MARSECNSASTLAPDGSGDWPFTLASNTSRHHSLTVSSRAAACASICPYSSSLTLVPMDFVRRLGLPIWSFPTFIPDPMKSTGSPSVTLQRRKWRIWSLSSAFAAGSRAVTLGYRAATLQG